MAALRYIALILFSINLLIRSATRAYRGTGRQ
jgi:hypothetical protein